MKRPRLHLRDLFWLVLVVALGLGWWLEHQRQITQLAELRLKLYIAEAKAYDCVRGRPQSYAYSRELAAEGQLLRPGDPFSPAN